jgi:cytochrome P450
MPAGQRLTQRKAKQIMHETTIADSAARGAAMAFDIRELAADFLDDPYPTYQALRQFDPVHCMPDGSYFLTRYDDCLKVYHDTATWSSDKKLDFRPNFADSLLYEHHTTSLVFNDPPYHTRVRKLLAPAFTPRALRLLQTRIESLVDRLLESAIARGEIDLIADFAAAIPIQLIGDMLGIPQGEREPLRDWSLAILGALEPVLSRDQFDTGVDAVAEFKVYLDEIIVHRAKSGESDQAEILSKLIAGTDLGSDTSSDDKLSKLELIHNCIFLLNAGHETTTNLIGNGVDLLIRHPMRCAICALIRRQSKRRSKNSCGWKVQTSSVIAARSKIPRLAALRCRRALMCISRLEPPTAIRRNSPILTVWISGGSRIGISPSAREFTPARECRLHEWKLK